jgi:transposase
MAVAPWIVSDELWELVEPLLPKKERRFRYPGCGCPIGGHCVGSCRARRSRCAAPAGRAWLWVGRYVLAPLGRVQRAGVWERLHELLLTRLRAAGEIEWARAIADSSQVQAKKGLRDGPEPGG